jgi:succinate-semialdehyde dehydrogenase / glutarate-semialdehyde dehydrogenase
MSIADKAQAHALLIDGQDVPTSATRTVHDPATGEPIAEVADASAADAERAVAAAPPCSTAWPTCSPSAPTTSRAPSRATPASR